MATKPKEITASIAGYRQLSDDEQALINEGKELAELVGAYIERVKNYAVPEGEIDQRWLAMGKTDLQRGFMAVTRAIARPTTF